MVKSSIKVIQKLTCETRNIEMKRMFKVDSLNKKLLAIFLTLTIAPLLITMLILYYSTERGFTKLITNQQAKMEQTIQSQFNNVSKDLLDLTKIYANDEELISAFQSKDREKLIDQVKQVYPRLQSEHRLDIFEFGDASGIVFLRGHNPDKHSDDKSSMSAIQHTLDGQPISGFEFGNSGLAVRAFAPIMDRDEVIGTLQTGVDSTFLNELNDMLQGVSIDLYDQDGTVVISSNEENVGKSNASIIADVMDNETGSRIGDKSLDSYLPMYDPTSSEMIGVIGMTQDISVIHQTKQQIIRIAFLITIITLLIVVFVSVTFSKTISNPIQKMAHVMEELSKGNLTIEAEDSKRNDEIGQLTNAIQVMKNTLHDTIAHVAEASSSVSAQSESLTHSAIEVKTGSEQIAMTMQDIAAGAEKQADRASDLAYTMGNFTAKIQASSEKSAQIQASSVEVLQMSDEGRNLVASSDRQMRKIDHIVKEAVSKMENLDQQTQEISKLVSVIQEVAKQTNLLALNATIEAARAGEQGKGFAVVAGEVRKLSEQVSASIGEITNIVSHVQTESADVTASLQSGYKEVEQGTLLIQTTNETFMDINNAVTEMVDNVKLITIQLSTFAGDSQEMHRYVEEIAAITEESAAGIEETAATSQQASRSMEEVAAGSKQLAFLAEKLNGLVRYFKF